MNVMFVTAGNGTVGLVWFCSTLTSPLKRIGGYMVTNDVQKRQGGKGGAAMELRRTRLFCKFSEEEQGNIFYK